jgi:hypothetical protein
MQKVKIYINLRIKLKKSLSIFDYLSVSWLARKQKFARYWLQKKIKKNGSYLIIKKYKTYRTVPAKVKVLTLKKNETLVFAQHLIHHGNGYDRDNLRFFVYLDLKLFKRENNSTTPIYLSKRRKNT